MDSINQRTRRIGDGRVAYGIACCRFNKGRPELLLVCPRCTYAYRSFARGKYNAGSTADMLTLFNGMTVDEKLDILSLNFMQIWYRMWLNTAFTNASYFIAKNKFESAFAVDNGARLRALISKSTHSQRMWEVPKGRKKTRNESSIDCAVREFYEETGINKKKYRLFPTVCRSYSYIDDGARYTNVYYFAIMREAKDISIDINSQQISEMSDIRWMNAEAIRCADHTGRLTVFSRPVFNYMKKHAK